MNSRVKQALSTKIIITAPDSLSPPQPLIRRQISESFISDSSDSSFDSLPDEDVQKIQNLTKALDSGIKSKLRQYKQITQSYSKKFSTLTTKVRNYENELEMVKDGYAELLNETNQTFRCVKGLRECAEKETKVQTEDNFTSQSVGEAELVEVVKRLREEVKGIKERMDRREKESEWTAGGVVFDRPKNKFCSCEMF